jgi:hypothetical protein
MSETHGIQAGHHEQPHGHEHAAPALPFSEAELKEFQKDDRHAGGAVIVLMAAIFSIGLILYITVAWAVAASPSYPH